MKLFPTHCDRPSTDKIACGGQSFMWYNTLILGIAGRPAVLDLSADEGVLMEDFLALVSLVEIG